MSTENILNEMDLPLSSSNVELETISRDKLRPLFDSKKFILRDEDVRDNGIDLSGEIIYKSRVTNFRFVIQLKATESINFNVDSSFSLSLNTSNINYLLNNGMPAYYILYSTEKDLFYYENVDSFVKELNEKKNNWKEQQSHVLRFKKILNYESIDKIFETTRKRGVAQRKITEKNIQLSTAIGEKGKIHIDKNLNIYDDSEIRELIENGGFQLINQGRWLDVIKLHTRASNTVNSTSIYNVILGVSYYNSGDLINAYSFLKKAKKINTGLKEGVKQYLEYYTHSSRYSLGLITEEEYYQEVNKFDSESFFYPYTKLENLKYKFSLKDQPSEEEYQNLLKDIDLIINDPKNDDNVKICASIEYIYYLGSFLNMSFFKKICLMNANPLIYTNEHKISETNKFIENYNIINRQYSQIQKEALECDNLFNYFISKNNCIKFNYELDYISSYLIHKTTEKLFKPDSDKKNQFIEYLEQLDKACLFYERVGHIQNLNVSLSIKFELLKYVGQDKQAIIIKEKIKDNIEVYELNEQKKRFESLINEGTSHEIFAKFINDIDTKNQANKIKLKKMRKELESFDSSETNSEKLVYENTYQIQLFPIGFFKFPKNKIDLVFEILNIADTAKSNFLFMFENSIIPIANTYYKLIKHEGPQNGELALKGFENFENMYRIRKAFFENKFYRIEIK